MSSFDFHEYFMTIMEVLNPFTDQYHSVQSVSCYIIQNRSILASKYTLKYQQ